jgi:DNA-binding HxlR family transcriptional regulator
MARALAVIGDRWTLMILRDCFLGVRRFDEFQARLGISRAIVAERLSRLTAAGVLDKVAYQSNPPRCDYRLTEKGRGLHPIVMAVVHWGDEHYAGEAGAPLIHRHKTCGCDFHPVQTCSECHEPIAPRDVTVRPGPGAADGALLLKTA